MKSTSYSRMIFTVVLTGLVFSLLTNFVVDPYGVYGALEIKGFNDRKHEEAPQRLVTATRVWLEAPDVVVLGSSRAIDGIDTNDPAWDGVPGTRRNLGMGNVTMEEVSAYFHHAHAVNPLRQAVIGLDFFAFNVFKEPPDDFDAARLATSEPASIARAALRDLASTLFSMDAVRASVQTLSNAASDAGEAHAGRPDGRGMREVFKLLERSYMRGTWFPCPTPRFELTDDGVENTGFDYLRTIIATARRDGVDLHLFISPVHARLLETMYQVGLWSQYEDWKRQLVELISKENTATLPRLDLWDFSEYNDLITEPVPLDGDLTSRMTWFLDSAHYTRKFGHLILSSILGKTQGTTRNVGMILIPDNVEEHLKRLSDGRRRYEASHPEDVNEIAQQVEETKSYRLQEHCRS